MDMETQEDGEVKDGEAKDGEAKDGETKALPRQPENSFWHGACGRNFEKTVFF